MVLLALLASLALGQDSPGKDSPDRAAAETKSSDKAAAEQAAEREREAGESSSHETRIDISPPKDDDKTHPASKDAVADLVPEVSDTSGIQEFHPWSPLKAMKDIEVGDFYF
jgi:hypothetical protein